MQIQGLGNKQAEQISPSPIQGSDSRIQAYQQQIAQLQQKLQDLSQNEELTMEEKMKKRQEINQQIHMVEQQMRQVQREIRQEQNKAGKTNGIDEMISTPKKSGADSMSANKMRSIIAGDQAMKQADGKMQLSTEMEGKARVLAGEISIDQQRGIDTGKKEEEMADLEQRTDVLKSDAIKVTADAADEIRKTDEEERMEEKEVSGKEKDAREEDTGDPGTGQVLSNAVQIHVDVKL